MVEWPPRVSGGSASGVSGGGRRGVLGVRNQLVGVIDQITDTDTRPAGQVGDD